MLSPSDFNNAVPQFTNGNYASNPINPQYIAEPDAESYNRGTEPLQTLPAQWWNWFVNKFTARFNKVNIYVKNIFNELAQVLSIFNITPDGTEQTPTTSQLKTVFETCYPQYVKTQTTGTAVGCIPTVGTALGTTNNNILVTDSTGKLKPSGITVGTAAGCDATLFARKTEVDALYGNVVGTPLGTAAVGTCTTFARSDHVHPDTDIMKGKLICGYYGVMINGSDGFGCPGTHASAYLRSPYYGFIPYCGNPTSGIGCVGTGDWPFEQMHAKTFYGFHCGGIHASANDNAYLCGPIYLSNGVTAYSEPGGDYVLGMDAYELGGRVHYTNAEQQAVGMLWVGGYYGSHIETKKYSAMRFWWCGQQGTPDWIWGTSNDCTKAFVYSPSCLSVGYATNACNVTGTVGIANGGTGATTAADGLNNLIAGMPSYDQALTGDACVMLLCSSTRIPGQFQANWTPINCFMQHVAVACASRAFNASCACCAQETQILRSFHISNIQSMGTYYYYENGRTCMYSNVTILYWIDTYDTASAQILKGGKSIQISTYEEANPDISYARLN